MSTVKSAIILAGGLGTRLRSVISASPKCLALVAGRPFIDYVIEHAKDHGIENFVFALGYKSKDIISHLKANHRDLNYKYTIESTPLGTGGGILLASQAIDDNPFYVFNGDTLFMADLNAMETLHTDQNSKITIALKPMNNFDRYGTVIVEDNKVTAFCEKQFTSQGLINGGIYLMDKSILNGFENDTVFSFEKEVLEPLSQQNLITALPFDSYFIDIGIPEDYSKANMDLKDFKWNN